MSARQLLDELRRLDVRLDYGVRRDVHDVDHHHHRADHRCLLLDAPKGVLTGELKTRIRESKASLLHLLEAERRTREWAEEQRLVIKWAEEPGWIAFRDPTTGEWHECRAAGCLPSMVAEANRRQQRER